MTEQIRQLEKLDHTIRIQVGIIDRNDEQGLSLEEPFTFPPASKVLDEGVSEGAKRRQHIEPLPFTPIEFSDKGLGVNMGLSTLQVSIPP